MKKQEKKAISAKDFDQAFEAGDVSGHLDAKTAKVEQPLQRINIDLPQEILSKVDSEAARVGVPRTSLIKIWIAQQVDRLAG